MSAAELGVPRVYCIMSCCWEEISWSKLRECCLEAAVVLEEACVGFDE